MEKTRYEGIASRRAMGGETGGVIILVVFMMLVFATLVAVGMSQNSLQEAVASGTGRQGVMARNAADSGIEWSVYWMHPENLSSATEGSAKGLANMNDGLMPYLLRDNSLSGRFFKLDKEAYDSKVQMTLEKDLSMAGTQSTVDAGFNIALMRMGKLEPTGVTQNPGSNQFRPGSGEVNGNMPNLWAIRSNGQVKQGPLAFHHAKEAWVSTPIQ